MPDIRADFSRPALVRRSDARFVPSPSAGVERILLDRIGDEVARATSFVRYAPKSRFPFHHHAMGEEYIVLSGVFSDASGDYGEGSYVRNPPGSGHAPWSDPGCEIFVKLRQFSDADRDFVHHQLFGGQMESGVQTLHRFGTEQIFHQNLSANQATSIEFADGLELLVLRGSVAIQRTTDPRAADRMQGWEAVYHDGEALNLEPHDWLRLPRNGFLALTSHEDAHIWCKTGHLPTR